tara:strand:- start:30 stop:365 length:336 start_codon:yes stop_codon:yes gene_type:complete
MKYLNNLKSKWSISSNFQLGVIFFVFAITGSISLKVTLPLLSFLKISKETFSEIFIGDILYWILRILIIFPIYQILLIIFGIIFFQFKFFWEFEKKILSRIGFKKFFIKDK